MKLYNEKSGWRIVLFLAVSVGTCCFTGCRQKVPDAGIHVYEGTRWAVVWEGDKIGVINAQTGQVVVPVEYMWPDESESFIEVPTGRNLIPEGYSWNGGAYNFTFVYLTYGNGKYGVYDVGEEEWLLPPVYSGVSPSAWDSWEVRNEEG